MSAGERGQPDGQRLERVEEATAFNERAIEQLSGEIADLNRRLQAFTKRLATLEERLGKVEQGPDEGEAE